MTGDSVWGEPHRILPSDSACRHLFVWSLAMLAKPNWLYFIYAGIVVKARLTPRTRRVLARFRLMRLTINACNTDKNWYIIMALDSTILKLLRGCPSCRRWRVWMYAQGPMLSPFPPVPARTSPRPQPSCPDQHRECRLLLRERWLRSGLHCAGDLVVTISIACSSQEGGYVKPAS